MVALYTSPVLVLGIDPGYHRCGYALLERDAHGPLALKGSGAIVTPRAATMAERLHELAGALDQLVALWQPQELAVEELYFTKNAKTVIGVAQARGVILARAAAHGLSVAEYTPTAVKSQLTGNGRADKQQVAYMVRRWCGMDESRRLDDELDAIAVSLCHGQRMAIPEVLR